MNADGCEPSATGHRSERTFNVQRSTFNVQGTYVSRKLEPRVPDCLFCGLSFVQSQEKLTQLADPLFHIREFLLANGEARGGFRGLPVPKRVISSDRFETALAYCFKFRECMFNVVTLDRALRGEERPRQRRGRGSLLMQESVSLAAKRGNFQEARGHRLRNRGSLCEKRGKLELQQVPQPGARVAQDRIGRIGRRKGLACSAASG